MGIFSSPQTEPEVMKIFPVWSPGSAWTPAFPALPESPGRAGKTKSPGKNLETRTGGTAGK
jgi:hypothetical protein